MFAIGILFLSLESVQLEPKNLVNEYHPMTIYMKNLSMSYINVK